MKKIILLTLIAFLINGCRYINTKERYTTAHESETLTIPEGVDSPNSSSTLEVPSTKSSHGVISKKNLSPPDMPIRTQQTENGDLRIENIKGFPVLTAKIDQKAMWDAMSTLVIEHWTQVSKSEENCEIVLHYNDVKARERETANFVKKIFTRNKFYTDFTGDFKMTCKLRGSVVESTFAKLDNSVARSFISDIAMNALYSKLK